MSAAQVYFAPSSQNNVGIYDTMNKQFSFVNTTGDQRTAKYHGASSVGTKVGCD